MKEYRVTEISWRRKHFLNEKSFRRYMYAAELAAIINRELRRGRMIRTPEGIVISVESPIRFRNDHSPFIGYSDIWCIDIEFADGKIVVKTTRPQALKYFKKFNYLNPKGKFVRLNLFKGK